MLIKNTFVMRDGIQIPVALYEKCAFCENDIVGKAIRHERLGIKHEFCSQKCKNQWCYTERSKTEA